MPHRRDAVGADDLPGHPLGGRRAKDLVDQRAVPAAGVDTNRKVPATLVVVAPGTASEDTEIRYPDREPLQHRRPGRPWGAERDGAVRPDLLGQHLTAERHRL